MIKNILQIANLTTIDKIYL